VNKKINTLVFFVVATAINIVLVMVGALVLLVPYTIWVAHWVPSPVNLLALVIIVVGSMAASFPIYRKLVEWFQKKVDIEKHFDPIIKTAGRGRRR